MTYVNTNVIKPTNPSPGNGGNMKENIYVFNWADVTSGYARDGNGIVMPGPLVFGAGAYAVKLYGTQDTIKATAESAGDSDAEGVNQTIEMKHPGNQQAILEFLTNWLGRSIGIAVEKCSDGSIVLYGSPCAPLRLSHKHDWDKDQNSATLTFKSAQKGPNFAQYQSTITVDTVKGTAAAAATVVNVAAGNGEYQLTTGSASAATLTDLTNAVDGGIYTILGSGGAYPSTIAKTATKFLLKNGTTWTGNAGSKIAFKAFSDDTASIKFIEISRQ